MLSDNNSLRNIDKLKAVSRRKVLSSKIFHKTLELYQVRQLPEFPCLCNSASDLTIWKCPVVNHWPWGTRVHEKAELQEDRMAARSTITAKKTNEPTNEKGKEQQDH